MINKEDVKTWLAHPGTKLLHDWIKKDRDAHFQNAANSAYNLSHLNAKSEYATNVFGICKGMDRILALIDECNEQVKEEEKPKLPEELQGENQAPISITIEEMISFVNGGANNV